MTLASRLHRVGAEAVVVAFVFWVVQLLAWIAMMIYVQFFPNRLKTSILYTIQISHWALVITCGTAATATWALVQSKHNARKLEQIQGKTQRSLVD